MPEQTLCCTHDSRYLCPCPQGYGSHAMPADAEECQCGDIKVSDESWRECARGEHVFRSGETRCECGKRTAGVEPA